MARLDFLKVVLSFKDKVLRLAKRLLVSAKEAEDATQEQLFGLWRSKEKLTEYRNVGAFAMMMTKNYCWLIITTSVAPFLSVYLGFLMKHLQ